jgi:hypothetical protein
MLRARLRATKLSVPMAADDDDPEIREFWEAQARLP